LPMSALATTPRSDKEVCLPERAGRPGPRHSAGLIRHADGTFGVWVRPAHKGRDDGEPVQNELADESGAPARFTTERDAQIAAFDWIRDIRSEVVSKPPPGSTSASAGEIERASENPGLGRME
jgi:hypothetical protein